MSWQSALGTVGTVVGYIWGPVGAAIGGAVGSFIGGAIDGPEQLMFDQEGRRLNDLSLAQSTSQYGLPIPIVKGRSRVGGQLIWSSGLKETINTSSTTTGGKGGQGVETTTTTTTYTYSVDMAMALCKGPIVGIRKIWADGQLIYNISLDADSGTLSESLKMNDIMTVYSGTETQLPNSLIQAYEGANNTPAFRGLAYVVFSDLQLETYGNRIPQLSFEVAQSGSFVGDNLDVANVSLSSVVLDLMTNNTRLEESDIDVSELTDEVVGFQISNKSNMVAPIQQLLNAYTMDLIESEDKLKFIKRGKSSCKDIPEVDLSAYESDIGGENLDLLTINRQKDSELPRQVSISYYNPDKKYEVGEQHASRMQVNTTQEISLDLPMILTDDEAAQLADKLLYTAWMSRTSYELKLNYDYLDLEPGDVISVTYDNVVYVMRIAYIEMGYPGLINIKAIAEDANTYISNVSGAGGGTVDETIPLISDTIINIMDIPLLVDTDDDPGYYVGVCGETTAWYGCLLYKSLDSGLTYSESAFIKSPCIMGVSLTTLSGGNVYTWDESNTVDVSLYFGELESKSEDLVLNGSNLGLLGDELIQWTNATLIGTKQYRLSGLLRARKGTDYGVDTHTVGERFVYLVPGTYTRIPSSYSEIGLPRYYKAVSYGNYADLADVGIYTHSAVGKRPLSPVHITATRDESGEITINWIRRTRIDGLWRDYVDVPLSETSEQYYVDINASDWTVFKRTISATTTSCVYTVAQQIEDFGSTQPSVEITVYQWSNEVGYGLTTKIII